MWLCTYAVKNDPNYSGNSGNPDIAFNFPIFQ